MIVTCGEALVDLVPEISGGQTLYRPVPGGSLFNLALGIARLGGRAGYLWELSSDDLGRSLLASLAADGVDVSAVRVSARATPVAVVDLSGAEARYNIADPDRVMTHTEPPKVPGAADCLVIGSAVLAREPVAAAIERLCATAPLLALDYNVRPPSIVDAAAYKARLLRLSRQAGIVKASAADLALIGEDDLDGFMTACVRDGAALAVLTRGADGATAWSRDGHAEAPSRATGIVDTVGAGDAFMAGLLAWLQARGRLARGSLGRLDADDLPALLGAAQDAAAATCRQRGAVMPFAADLDGISAGWSSVERAAG